MIDWFKNNKTNINKSSTCTVYIHLVVLCLPHPWSNWNLENMVVFEKKEKPGAWRKIVCKSKHISSSRFSLFCLERSDNRKYVCICRLGEKSHPTYGVSSKIWAWATLVRGSGLNILQPLTKGNWRKSSSRPFPHFILVSTHTVSRPRPGWPILTQASFLCFSLQDRSLFYFV